MPNNILHPTVVAMLAEAEEIFRQHNITFYLVGAIARDINIAHKQHTAAARRTNDVDIAIMLSGETAFNTVKDALLATGNFTAHSTEAIKLYYKKAVELDLLPFGDIENEYSEVEIQQPHLIINVPAFKECAGYVQPIAVDGITLNICPIEGIVLLKLLAQDDKPERTKDISDITYFIDHYFMMHTNDVYDNYSDVINLYANEQDAFQALVGSRIIGRKIAEIINSNAALLQRIQQILLRKTGSNWQAMLNGIND